MRTTAIILAAGKSTRMGGPNKLLAELDDKPLVRHVTENALASIADEVLVVTGHMRNEVEAELNDLTIRVCHNPDFEAGLSSSLRAGVTTLAPATDAALILLGDMPFITSNHMNTIIAAAPGTKPAIVVATSGGQRRNPVLWSHHFFDQLKTMTGDTGGRALQMAHPEALVTVEIGAAAAQDIDTPSDFMTAKHAK